MSYMLQHLQNGYQVDQAILSEEDRIVVRKVLIFFLLVFVCTISFFIHVKFVSPSSVKNDIVSVLSQPREPMKMNGKCDTIAMISADKIFKIYEFSQFATIFGMEYKLIFCVKIKSD